MVIGSSHTSMDMLQVPEDRNCSPVLAAIPKFREVCELTCADAAESKMMNLCAMPPQGPLKQMGELIMSQG